MEQRFGSKAARVMAAQQRIGFETLRLLAAQGRGIRV
jgi:hypothetical protein